MGGGRPENVLDELEEILAEHRLDGTVGVTVPHHPSSHELNLVGPGSWSAEGSGRAALAEIESLDAIGRAAPGKRGRVGLKLADSWIAEKGKLLEAGSALPLATSDLARDRRFAVDFCDPNATKALHVGHLRNLALGNSLAGLMRACGADVVTQSQIGDVGRSVAETMAGYTMFADGQTPEDRGQKSDHFVGECYSRFVQHVSESGALPQGPASDPALSREEMEWDDLAAELQERWRSGDPDVHALWQRIRDWAMQGHDRTFARLGVSLDRPLFESDFLEETEDLAERLVQAGIAERTRSNATLYATGDDSYPFLVLQRPDGHSTQHLRYIALWHATGELLGSATSLEVMGDEWLPLAKYGDEILRRLDPDETTHPTVCVLHGMVDSEEGVVKSSSGESWLIDSLLDELTEDPKVRELAAGDAGQAERLAAIAMLGACLNRAAPKRMLLSRGSLLEVEANPGWALASGAVGAWDPRHDGAPDPPVEDRDYRFLLVQSQVHRRLARRALKDLDVLALVRYHAHLSRWFLSARQTPSLARAMRTLASTALSSLGMPHLHPGPAEPVPAEVVGDGVG
jgi:hypothetical protein